MSNKKYWFCLIFSILFLLNCSTMLSIIKEKLPPPKRVEGGILFRLDSPAATTVNIAGEFNDWCGSASTSGRFDPTIDALKDDNGDGIWEIVLDLPPGRHIYKFVIDQNNWITDPSNMNLDRDDNSFVIVE
jgi:1,4-alpha-glucan branching enzyme